MHYGEIQRSCRMFLGKLSNNQRWFHVVPPIWSEEFVPAIDAALAALAIELGRSNPVVKCPL